jgi:hypothetical protein
MHMIVYQIRQWLACDVPEFCQENRRERGPDQQVPMGQSIA